MQDFAQFKNNVPELKEFNDISNNGYIQQRVSSDKTVNKFGRDLISFCIAYSLPIVNGRVGDDINVGGFTYVGPSGNSVIDYVRCSQDLFHLIINFSIERRTESSHFRLSCTIETYIELTENLPETLNDTPKIYTNTAKYKFNDDTVKQFRNRLFSFLMNNQINSIFSRIDDELVYVDDILKDFQEMLRLCSKDCIQNIFLRFNNCKQPKWFGAECRMSKAEKYKCLKLFRKSQTMEDLEKYITVRNDFRKLCV